MGRLRTGDIIMDSDDFAEKRKALGLTPEPGPSVVVRVKWNGEIVSHLVGKPETKCTTDAWCWKKKE